MKTQPVFLPLELSHSCRKMSSRIPPNFRRAWVVIRSWSDGNEYSEPRDDESKALQLAGSMACGFNKDIGFSDPQTFKDESELSKWLDENKRFRDEEEAPFARFDKEFSGPTWYAPNGVMIRVVSFLHRESGLLRAFEARCKKRRQ